SQTHLSDNFKSIMLSNHIDLHHSQTQGKLYVNNKVLSNHIDLHHSQTYNLIYLITNS
ncbi:hypothetical protein EB26_01370, partial [Enterococcus cecorum]